VFRGNCCDRLGRVCRWHLAGVTIAHIKLASIFHKKKDDSLNQIVSNISEVGNSYQGITPSAMSAHQQRGKHQRGRPSAQTLRDRLEVARRIRGRELELVRLMAILSSIIPSPKKKETLTKLAQKWAARHGGSFLPRLEFRCLPLMILWFADHCPAIFFCSSIDEFLEPPHGNAEQEAKKDGQPDAVDWLFDEEYATDVMEDDGETFEL
jgi:hypothetical protein